MDDFFVPFSSYPTTIGTVCSCPKASHKTIVTSNNALFFLRTVLIFGISSLEYYVILETNP